jgi:hypothetical protein
MQAIGEMFDNDMSLQLAIFDALYTCEYFRQTEAFSGQRGPSQTTISPSVIGLFID